jgi:pimeloyl-ACP methyl ester carboxylesterase
MTRRRTRLTKREATDAASKGPVTRDAVVIVPGIMGSELAEKTTGRILWGLSDPRWYVSAWTSGTSLESLELTDDERSGRYGRVVATRLLRFPAFAPVLAGLEPYSRLLKSLQAAALHPDAVAEFPYDWRLPCEHNANLLAEFSHRHLAAWRNHPAHIDRDNGSLRDDDPVSLVVVAHSMGGLLAQHLATIPGMAEEIRATITLGTPFFGAPKAVQLLASGAGTPLPMPHARIRTLAAGLPGLHDLLPVYRCVTDNRRNDGRSPEADQVHQLNGARRLTASDIGDVGGDPELAQASWAWHEKVLAVPPVGHVQVVGSKQPTVQALSIDAGLVTGHRYTLQPASRAGGAAMQVDLSGDGTVPREAAQLPGLSAMPLAQTHGALAATSEARVIVEDVLMDRRTGPWQGVGELGLDIPDTVSAGSKFEAEIFGAERPTDVTCRVIDVASGLQVDAPRVRVAGRRLIAILEPRTAGLYRVSVDGSSMTPVSQLILAVTPQAQ